MALTTFSDLVGEAIAKCRADAVKAGMQDDGKGLDAGGLGAQAYAEAVGMYLAFAVDKVANICSSITSWMNDRGAFRETFARQAIPMVWDFAESNPLADSGGSLTTILDKIFMSVDNLPACIHGFSLQKSGQSPNNELYSSDRKILSTSRIISTDPPYYDNIGYADLSDFFYVWLKQTLGEVFPQIYSTIAVPKADELVATPYRHGSKDNAEQFFLKGMTEALQRLAGQSHQGYPLTIYYAFKQAESQNKDTTSSTGWETFLGAVLRAGFIITGTWPMRTEGAGRIIATGTNALASSIVLVCRRRDPNAPTISRREFTRELNAVLPEALLDMTRGGVNSPVAPVDLSQAIIGPGMAVFSKYSAVLEADGTPMSVRTALTLINRFFAEDDFDADTQFCLAWFDQVGWDIGKYGEADVLARAKGTSVGGLVEAGVVESSGGNLRLLRWAQMPSDWNPAKDKRLPVWEGLHQLIRALNQQGETEAGKLLAHMLNKTEAMRSLAYRLYTLCERKGWAEDARAYNELITSWPSIEQTMSAHPAPPGPEQIRFEM